MIRLLTAVLLFASFHAVAQTQVPNVFEDGTPASAAEVNENFDTLEAAIDAIPEGPAGPQGEQGPAGDADGFGNNTNWGGQRQQQQLPIRISRTGVFKCGWCRNRHTGRRTTAADQ